MNKGYREIGLDYKGRFVVYDPLFESKKADDCGADVCRCPQCRGFAEDIVAAFPDGSMEGMSQEAIEAVSRAEIVLYGKSND